MVLGPFKNVATSPQFSIAIQYLSMTGINQIAVGSWDNYKKAITHVNISKVPSVVLRGNFCAVETEH